MKRNAMRPADSELPSDRDATRSARPSASSLARMLGVLDLFSRDAAGLSADEAAARLGLARTTCYRYLRELTRAGLLISDSGVYGLGPRIIQLDRRIRQTDPLLTAGRPVLAKLVERTGAIGVISTLFDGQVILVHQEGGDDSTLAFSRGTTMPTFRSASSRVILAYLKTTRLKRLWEARRNLEDAQTIGADWDAVVAHMQSIRQQGYCLSHGELHPSVVGIAVPVLRADGAVVASVALVFPKQNFALFAESALGAMLIGGATEIGNRLGRANAQPDRSAVQRPGPESGIAPRSDRRA